MHRLGPAGLYIPYAALYVPAGGVLGAGTPAGDFLGDEASGLSIDFAQDSALVRGHTPNFLGVPQDLLTVVRASTATYFDSAGVLQTAANNILRIDCEPLTPFTAKGLLIEEARTNLNLYARDFTDAAWTKSNMTTAKTATGPDGVVNSASTLTATAGNATALQAITSGSAARISSMFVKRRTGSGTINITHDNGTTWTAVTVTAGWTRVSNPVTTAANPTVGVRIVTSGDAIDVDYFQHELGSVITSPIETVASQVTRAADQISLATSAFPLSATAGTMVFEGMHFTPGTPVSTHWLWSLDDGTTNERILNYFNTITPEIFVVDGAATQVSMTDGTVVANTPFKTASAWALNDFAWSRDGRTAVTDAVGTLPTVTSLKIGRSQSNAFFFKGWVQKLKYIPLRKSNADLVTMST